MTDFVGVALISVINRRSSVIGHKKSPACGAAWLHLPLVACIDLLYNRNEVMKE